MPRGIGYNKRRGVAGRRGRRVRFPRSKRGGMFRRKMKKIRPIRRGKRWPN